MSSPFGWLLLLACAPVHLLATRGRLRAAAAVAGGATALWLALAPPPDDAGGALTLACFGVAVAVMLAHGRRLSARLRDLAHQCDVDEATGCLNRRGFRVALTHAVADARRRDHPVALLALDLDHFKLVNDRFGHLTGDAVLREVGARLIESVAPAGGRVARLGGEEFAILLADADAEQGGVAAERVLALFREQALASLPPRVRLTVSIGIAAERIDGANTAEALRARADEALYAAKRSGRNRALLWAPGVPSHATPVHSLAGIGGSTAPRRLIQRGD